MPHRCPRAHSFAAAVTAPATHTTLRSSPQLPARTPAVAGSVLAVGLTLVVLVFVTMVMVVMVMLLGVASLCAMSKVGMRNVRPSTVRV